MARISTRRPEEDEDEMLEDVTEDEIDDELDEAEARPSVPAVSDSRRRRQLKRGDAPVASVVTTPTRKEYATPSQRTEVAKSNNFVVRFVQNTIEYFREVQVELSKVVWLSREDALRLTRIVIIVTAISAAFLGTVSFIFALLTQALATSSSTVLAGGITIGLIVVVAGLWLFRDRVFVTHDFE
ncbi:MAG: preprotein translocase subunit SecE [Chloroflexota bacterium]